MISVQDLPTGLRDTDICSFVTGICNRQENEILGGLCKPMFLMNIAMK